MADMKREPSEADYIYDAVCKIDTEMVCVNCEDRAKRVFLVAWLARGEADKAIVKHAPSTSKRALTQAINKLDQPLRD